MYDFEIYENAVADFRETQQLAVSPLISSDFHFQNLSDYLIFKSDFQNLLDISKREKWANISALPFDSHNDTILVTNSMLVITFATKNLVQMNGYHPEEVIGQSPKIFQGRETDLLTSSKIGDAIRQREPFEHTILNYRKDGSLYKCHIKGFPLVDKRGNLKHFIAIEKAA